MKGSRIRRAAISTELFGAVLFAFASGFPPFDDATEVDLSLHMLQHFLIVFAGIMIAYPHYGRRLLKQGWGGRTPYVALLGCTLLVAFWHMPVPWDEAVISPGVHVIEHLSFLLVGVLAGSWLLLLSDSGKIGAMMAAFFGHMGYAVVLIAPFGVQVYALYSLADQIIMGWILLLSGPLLMVGVAYVVVRNPDWLGGFSANPGTGIRRGTFLNKIRVPRWMSPLGTFALLAVFVGYLAITAYALGTTPGLQGPGPRVYIVETPLSWQFSPQETSVVVGVNATVTWVSRSISYDTVTDRAGSFNSGTIVPGGTFSYTFTNPGIYHYYCQFHPWMTGIVVVTSRS